MPIWLVRALLVCALPGASLAQIAVLQIKVLEGEGAVHGAGSRSPRPLLVQVCDETGHPVEGAAVSFHMPDEGPGGVFANGLRTDLVITGANGRAAARNMRFNRTAGQFHIRILVVKDQARAGTVSSQFLSVGSAGSRTARRQGGSRRTWLAVALLAAGATGGGIAATLMGGSSRTSTPSAAAPEFSIGVPTITVGMP